MEFEWDQDAPPLDGELLRVGSAGVTSISFTTLQIEVGIERRGLLYAWGRVRVISDGEELRPGVAIPLACVMRRNSGKALATYAASRIKQLRKSPSAATHLLKLY
jgi:hypothetical protein